MIDRTVMAMLIVSAAVGAVGCSTGADEARIGAATVEPELLSRVSRVGPVPVVIDPSRPYHTSRGASSRAAPPRPFPGAVAAVTPDVRDEVESMIRGYLRDFNRHDTAAVVAHWSEGGVNLDVDSGESTAGRAAVREVFAALFAEDDEATIDIDLQAIRPVRRDVAVVDGTSTVRFGDGTRAGSRFSAVLVKEGGHWLLDSVRESARPEAAADQPLDQLAWLVGTWQDPRPGMAAVTRCFWSAGRAFLIRTHAVSGAAAAGAAAAGIPALLPDAEAVEREVTEIIGWDPENQVIRSWVFTSAGRFADGTWTRAGDGWRVRLEGRGGDTGRSCECVLTRRGPDAVSVSSISSGLGDRADLTGDLAPACDVVRVVR